MCRVFLLVSFKEFKDSFKISFDLLVKFKLEFGILILFFMRASPEIDSSMEFFYGHFLNFSNGDYSIKNFIANFSLFLSIIFLIYCVGNKLKKKYIIVSFLIVILTTCFLLKIVFTKDEKFIMENTIFAYFITFFYNFFIEFVSLSILAILTMFCPKFVEATFISLIDFIIDLGYHVSSLLSNVFIRILDLDIENHYQQLEVLLYIHIGCLFIPLIFIIFFRIPLTSEIRKSLENNKAIDFDSDIFEIQSIITNERLSDKISLKNEKILMKSIFKEDHK